MRGELIARRRTVRGFFSPVQVLQSGNFEFSLTLRAQTSYRGIGGRERGDAGHVVANRCATNGFFVVEGFAAERGVNDQIHFARFYQVDDIRPAFVYFEHCLDLTRSLKRRRGAARGNQLESEDYKFFRKRRDCVVCRDR